MEYYGDFIIPCYVNEKTDEDFEYRLRNIKMICELLPVNMNVIVVEHTKLDQEKKYITELQRSNLMRKDVDYIEAQYEGEFVKGWLYNIGYKHTKTNRLFLGESDVVFSPTYWIGIYDQLNKATFQWAHCWDKLYVIGSDNKTIIRSTTVITGGAEGGVVYFDKEFYRKIGGSNEWMLGLGGMDNEIIVRCQQYTRRRYMLTGDIYHLWHPQSSMKGTSINENSKCYKDNRKKNINIVRTARRNSKLYSMQIAQYADEIGGDAPLCEKITIFNEEGTQLIIQGEDQYEDIKFEVGFKPEPQKSTFQELTIKPKAKRIIIKKKPVTGTNYRIMPR